MAALGARETNEGRTRHCVSALSLALDLAETRSPPSFEASSAVVYQDAVVISEQLTAALADLTLFSTRDRNQLVALEEQLVAQVPMESHDKYVDIIITDSRVIYKI